MFECCRADGLPCTHCFDDLRFFAIVHKTGFDPVLVLVKLHCAQEVDLLRVDLEDHFFLYCLCMGKVLAWLTSTGMSVAEG